MEKRQSAGDRLLCQIFAEVPDAFEDEDDGRSGPAVEFVVASECECAPGNFFVSNLYRASQFSKNIISAGYGPSHRGMTFPVSSRFRNASDNRDHFAPVSLAGWRA